jgi:hypothetical protein
MPEVPILTVESPSAEENGDDKGAKNKLGFRITGGADFGMPITVFQVILLVLGNSGFFLLARLITEFYVF